MTEAIRILHVLGGTGLGGAESRIMDLYRQMDREQIQFDFLVHSDAVRRAGDDASRRAPQFYDQEIRDMGGRIYVLPRFKGYNYPAYRHAAEAFFAAHHEFRVVQGHMTSTAGIYLPIAKKAGVPLTVAHSRAAGVDGGVKGIATRFLRRNLARKADLLFACSVPAGEDAFGKEAVRRGLVRIVHNAIDAARFSYDPVRRGEVRERLGMTDNLVLGHVGRFDPLKNHAYLLDVFAALCKIRQDAGLLLLGEGGGMEAAKEKCAALGIADKVRFMGNRKNTEDYYQAMDAFVLPSFYEGLPGVLLEAQAAGLQCFVSDAVTREAQATDLVNYMSLSEPPAKWAQAILAGAGYDRKNTCKQLVENGFDVREQAKRYANFYLNGDSSEL